MPVERQSDHAGPKGDDAGEAKPPESLGDAGEGWAAAAHQPGRDGRVPGRRHPMADRIRQ